MTRARPIAVALAFLLAPALLAGCLDSDPGRPAPSAAMAAGVHPHPAGGGAEWPLGLEGPFGLLSIENVKVPAADEILLDGWVLRPDVPAGTKVPVVLWSAPYFGQCSYLPNTADPADYPSCHYDLGTDPELRDGDDVSEAVPIDRLLSEGYAVAVFNVRGTGNSGGCFEWFGPKEQADQALLVEWLGQQGWSNGRVAMMGLSYHGTTPWEAAIQNPPSLKTIVVAGMVSDAYTFSHTPQGATFAISAVFEAQFFLRVSGSPPINGPPEHWTVEHAPAMAERVCPETADVLREEFSGTYTDVRNGAYWDERRLIDRFPGVTASVLLTHGFDDNVGSGHQQQENAAWDSLTLAPKRMMQGQWPHMMPTHDAEFGPTYGQPFEDVAVAWFDYWLKGIGSPEKLGVAEYQDGDDGWHASSAWPPVEASDEVLYLTQRKAAAAPGDEASSFQSTVNVGTTTLLCGDELLPAIALRPTNQGLAYLSEPVMVDTLVAGNPIAYLQVESDLPGGLVAIDLFDVPASCADAVFLGRGVADLRFHDGVFTGHDFPVGEPTPVRFDITDFAEWLPAGHRLGIVLSYGDPIDRTAPPYPALITIHGDGTPESSHVVVPVVQGGFGGEAPTLRYPPRPFVPAEGQRADSR
jgi:putative CocE/NonD family hydrolase